jgi:hypothetical protein
MGVKSCDLWGKKMLEDAAVSFLVCAHIYLNAKNVELLLCL